jgi:hypothetical protein
VGLCAQEAWARRTLEMHCRGRARRACQRQSAETRTLDRPALQCGTSRMAGVWVVLVAREHIVQLGMWVVVVAREHIVQLGMWVVVVAHPEHVNTLCS